MIVFEREDARERVEAQALALAKIGEAPDGCEQLFWAAVNTACAICARKDIPEAMECALAVILSEFYTEGYGKPITSVKRGDTAITYAPQNGMSYRVLLAPFIRLGTVVHG